MLRHLLGSLAAHQAQRHQHLLQYASAASWQPSRPPSLAAAVPFCLASPHNTNSTWSSAAMPSGLGRAPVCGACAAALPAQLQRQGQLHFQLLPLPAALLGPGLHQGHCSATAAARPSAGCAWLQDLHVRPAPHRGLHRLCHARCGDICRDIHQYI